LNKNPFHKESLLYERLEKNQLRCETCERRCIINEGRYGFCKTKVNINSKLISLLYGNISSISNNPIEKKPLYHFFPGTKALTIGTWGCNFTCPFCQNWEISKSSPSELEANYLSISQFVSLLKRFHSDGTSFSFNEPTLQLEYAMDVMKSLASLSYYHTYVTNMYMTEKALNLLIESGCHAFCANVKGDKVFYKKYCSVNSEIVWRNLQIAKTRGAHVEVVTLIIPRENDSEEILREIAHNIRTRLGENTPWHCNAYYPAYKYKEAGLANFRTPPKTLEQAHKIGKDEGLKFVYIGNIHGHKFENTYCPQCETLLIERNIFGVSKNLLTKEHVCPKCGEHIPLIDSLEK